MTNPKPGVTAKRLVKLYPSLQPDHSWISRVAIKDTNLIESLASFAPIPDADLDRQLAGTEWADVDRVRDDEDGPRCHHPDLEHDECEFITSVCVDPKHGGWKQPEFVYFIQGVSGGPIKIGRTTDLIERLRQIQIGSAVKLVILHSFEGDSRDEAQLHRQNHSAQLNGEWFEPTEELVGFIGCMKDVARKGKRPR